MMGRRADSADATGDLGHVLGGAAKAEDFEASQLRYLQVRVFHVARAVEEDLDSPMALEPGDRLDGDSTGLFKSL